MLKVLLFFLTKIYPKDKIPIKELKNNKIPKEIFDIKNSAISTMWDIKLRDLHTDNKIICLPTNLQNYKEMFKNFSKKFNFDKKKYKLLLKVCLFKNIEFIFTEDSYEEWICASVFYKYKKKIFYFEHIYGFLEIDYENDLTFNQKIDRFFLDFASKIENKYLQIAEANLTQRVKGIYNSASLFHTKRKNLEKEIITGLIK